MTAWLARSVDVALFANCDGGGKNGSILWTIVSREDSIEAVNITNGRLNVELKSTGADGYVYVISYRWNGRGLEEAGRIKPRRKS